VALDEDICHAGSHQVINPVWQKLQTNWWAQNLVGTK
jgi:hypothetical protein